MKRNTEITNHDRWNLVSGRPAAIEAEAAEEAKHPVQNADGRASCFVPA